MIRTIRSAWGFGHDPAKYDVVVIGAGIVGAACADEFSRCGMSVAVVERDEIGSGATAAGMGHIVAMDDSDAQFALTRYSQELWKQLRPEMPADVEYEQCGTIWIAADAEEMAAVLAKRDYYEKRMCRSKCSTRKRSRRRSPICARV